MPFIVQNKKTGEVGNTICNTKRGATNSKNAIIKGILQGIYLKEPEHYIVFLWVNAIPAVAADKSLLALSRQITKDELELYAKRKKELEEDWQVIEKEFKETP